MIDVKIFEGNLYNYNMIVIEEKSTDALIDRICYMLKHDINSYQKEILLKALEKIEIINKITESA